MNSQILKLFLIFILIVCITSQAFALDVPPLKRRVTNLVGVLSPSQQGIIEEKLYLFESQTSNQLAVLIIPSRGEGSI